MHDSPAIPTTRPLIVRLGLLGLKTRQAALAFMWISIIGAVMSVALKFWLGSLLLLAALWYWYALTWEDKNGGWK
jgi:hypothetical protein